MAGSRRLGQGLLLAGLVLLAVYLALANALHRYIDQPRHEGDPVLTAEMADAEFVDDETPPAGAWPQWRGYFRDGVAHAPDLLTSWPKDGPTRLWKAKVGEGYSSFAVSGGRVFSLLYENNSEAVVCWAEADGKELWRHTYPSTTDPSYPGPRATPTVDGDRVYTAGGAGMLLCLDAGSGKVHWQHDLVQELGARGGQWGQAFSPLVDADLVITVPGARGSSLAAFNKLTGAPAWQAGDDLPGYSSPVIFTASGVRQVVTMTGNSVVGVVPRDGRLLWRFPWETQFQVNAATPVVFHTRRGGRLQDYVFVTSGYGKGCALLRLERTAAGDFRPLPVFVNNFLCSHHGSPVRYRDHVFGFNESTLVCMDLRTGEIRWSKNGYGKGTLLRVDGRLLVMGEKGQLALMEATPKEPAPLAEAPIFRVRRSCWTLPALADGRAFLRGEEELFCLDLRKK
jgi:outer membrane protein assembly factor BamB